MTYAKVFLMCTSVFCKYQDRVWNIARAENFQIAFKMLIFQDLLNDHAINLLHSMDEDEPFFMILTHTVPHHPLQVGHMRIYPVTLDQCRETVDSTLRQCLLGICKLDVFNPSTPGFFNYLLEMTSRICMLPKKLKCRSDDGSLYVFLL